MVGTYDNTENINAKNDNMISDSNNSDTKTESKHNTIVNINLLYTHIHNTNIITNIINLPYRLLINELSFIKNHILILDLLNTIHPT